MISTIEFVVIAILVIITGIAVWNLVIVLIYNSYMNSFIYSRGANSDKPKTISLSCESGGGICIYKATQVCTLPNSDNFETSLLDPISTDGKNYGNFNPDTTIDLTQDMSSKCNGKSSATYNFTGEWPSGMLCQDQYGNTGQTQLIATYYCVNSNSDCKSS